jgi:hypothetical protein
MNDSERHQAGFEQAEREFFEDDGDETHPYPNNARPGTPEWSGYEEAVYIFLQK